MKTTYAASLFLGLVLGISPSLKADQGAKVTESVNIVDHGSREAVTTHAPIGTLLHDGEFLKTGAVSRAELLLPTASITRLGANTIFNYSIEANTVDLQAGTILFCKPKNANELSIKTAAVTAGITGTTGFVSVHGSSGHQSYIFGIIEGKATATDEKSGKSFTIGAGEILEFKPGGKPLLFAFDVPKFVKTSPLLHKFKGHLPNQSEIDAELASYQDDVQRGFIQPPSGAIDYSGDVPLVLTPAYDSALQSQGQPKGNSSPPRRPSRPPVSTASRTEVGPYNPNFTPAWTDGPKV